MVRQKTKTAFLNDKLAVAITVLKAPYLIQEVASLWQESFAQEYCIVYNGKNLETNSIVDKISCCSF